jgi:DNA-binding MarR family transcriptional regulator
MRGTHDEPTELSDADPSVGDLIFRITRRLRHASAEVTEPLGLNPHQVRALHVMLRSSEEGARPTTIAERLHVAPRSATDVIDALVSKGLATRVPDPSDRRAVRIHLTDEGRVALAHADEARDLVHAEAFGVLSEAERALLIALLRKVDEAASDPAKPR